MKCCILTYIQTMSCFFTLENARRFYEKYIKQILILEAQEYFGESRWRKRLVRCAPHH